MTDVFASQRYGGESYAAAVTPLLGQDERLIAVVKVDLCGLIRGDVPRRHRSPEPARSAGERVMDVLFLPVTLTVAALELLDAAWTALRRALVAPLRGRPLQGGWRSQAGRFVVSVRTLPSRTGRSTSYDNEHALLAFTTHRVLIVHPHDTETPYLGEFPREQLRGVRIRHWTFSSRVDLTFADGSLVAVEARKPEAEALERIVTS
ncbi:hypothetical protein OG607_23650 [Streptomyces sp. NBC_01537]|uniref:hypothetical protein n=1 Tax=Streptomyces sp. NBC_01537 TaxID=2903896 RepID=UPI00386FD8F2